MYSHIHLLAMFHNLTAATAPGHQISHIALSRKLQNLDLILNDATLDPKLLHGEVFDLSSPNSKHHSLLCARVNILKIEKSK